MALINLDDMTIEDVEDLAAALGITKVGDLNKLADQDIGELPLRVLATVAWISKRATDPGFTLEMARKLKVRELNELVLDTSPNAEGGETAASLGSGTTQS